MKVLIGKINSSIWFNCMKMDELDEDKSKNKVQRVHTCRDPRRHILLVSLLLWCKMVAVCKWWPCAASFGLQPANCGQADKNSSFCNLKKKIYIRSLAIVFFFAVFDVR